MSLKLVACLLTILSLCLVPVSLLFDPRSEANLVDHSGLYVVSYNPYAGINWDTVFRLKTQLHAHTPLEGEWRPWTVVNNYAAAGFDALGISDPNQLTWPWTNYEEFFTPEAGKMVPIPNDEVELNTAHVHLVTPFITSPVNGSLYGTDVQGCIDAISAVGGLPFVSHPKTWGLSLTYADSWNGFQGIDIYNRVEGEELQPYNFQLWDHLLTDPTRAQKHIWGIAVDDSYGASGINSGWIVVYASQKTAVSMEDSIIAGSFVAVVNSADSINSITQMGNTLVVDTSSPVVWKADGQQVVGTNSTLDLDTLEPGYTYVRAEVNDRVFTQPIFISQTRKYTIFEDGFEDAFDSWDDIASQGSGWIDGSLDASHSGLHSAKIAAIREDGDQAYAIKSLGETFKRINIRAYVNFSAVSTINYMVGPLSLISSNSAHAARAAVLRNFGLNKWGIRTTNASGIVTWHWESGSSALETNRWYCIELEAAMSVHGYTTLWIDGEMKLNVTDIYFGSSTITNVSAGEYMTPYTLSTWLKYYIDDVVVADSYIGPADYGSTQSETTRENPLTTPLLIIAVAAGLLDAGVLIRQKRLHKKPD